MRKVGRKRVGAPKRKMMRRNRLAKRLMPRVHYFKRSIFIPTAYQTSVTGDTFGSYMFALNNLPNFSEFTTLFDQYKILGGKWTLIPKSTEANVGSGAVASSEFNSIMSVLDFDDNNPPSSINDLVQYQSYRVTRGNKVHSRYLKPCAVQAFYNSPISTAYGPKRNVWIDINNAGVPHYGIKYCIPQTASVIKYDAKVDIYFACKNLR